MVYKIQDLKPSLKKQGSVDTSAVKPALAYDSNSDIIMFSEESWLSIVGSWLKSAVLLLLSALLIFAALYTVLAATLFFVTVVDDKPTFVARNTFLGGVPSVNDRILASKTTPASTDPLSRLQSSFLGVQDPVVVQVLTEPNDTVSVSGGNVTVTGKNTNTYDGVFVNDKGDASNLPSTPMTNQILVKCLSGSCTPGQFFLVKIDNVYGEVKNIEGVQ